MSRVSTKQAGKLGLSPGPTLHERMALIRAALCQLSISTREARALTLEVVVPTHIALVQVYAAVEDGQRWLFY